MHKHMVQKNTDGHLGPICNNCGGYGYTLTFGSLSSSAGCHACNQSGIAQPTAQQLQEQINKLTSHIHV